MDRKVWDGQEGIEWIRRYTIDKNESNGWEGIEGYTIDRKEQDRQVVIGQIDNYRTAKLR